MTDEPVDPIVAATAPAAWLLELGLTGVPLTQTFTLACTVVREAAERWPGWWNAELFGPPHREADVRVVGELRDGLLRLKLLRRRGRNLLTTPGGRELLADRPSLLRLLLGDLGGGDEFGELVAGVVVAELLRSGAGVGWDELTLPATRAALRGGWRTPDGSPPSERDVGTVISHVVCLGEAYGVIRRDVLVEREVPRRTTSLTLTAAARAILAPGRASSGVMPVFVFKADLQNVSGVSAQLAVRADQHLTALHDAIQEAFGWYDDHLYSFWLDGRFWGEDEHEYTTPDAADDALHTADVPLAELDLAVGQKIAYVFDFGDEWRVRLTLREQAEPDAGTYPRVVSRKGKAPEQYGAPEGD